jgi:hypothetical protein
LDARLARPFLVILRIEWVRRKFDIVEVYADGMGFEKMPNYLSHIGVFPIVPDEIYG